MQEKYSILHLEGGIGKNILATSVVSSLKSSDPQRKIILVTAWPQVWFNNPNVDQIYVLGQTANFYKNFISGKDVKIYRQEPYHTETYLLKKEHLILTWCRLCGVEWNRQMPQLFFSPLELEYLKLKVFNGVNKPIMMIQGNGGGPEGRPYSWYRDLPYNTIKEVVDYFKKDYHIFQIGYDNQPLVEGCHRLNGDLREMLGVWVFSQKRLMIDSFGQHACAALGLKGVVCWIGNNPGILGYDIHTNIKFDADPKFDTLHSSYLEDADIGGNPVQYPFDTLDIFNTQEIIQELIKQ